MARTCSCGPSTAPHPTRGMAAPHPGQKPSSKGKAVLRDITVYVDGWDTTFSYFVFDVVVTVPSMNSIWRFSAQSHEVLRLDRSYGAIACHDVPLLAGGIIAVECTDNRTGRMFQPSSSTDPFVSHHIEWKLNAKTAAGSVSDANTSTRAITNPQWNAQGSISFKESGKILGFGVESTQTGQVTRNWQLTVNTNQAGHTVTTPTEIVVGAELHRAHGRPDLAMNMTGRESVNA